MTIVMIAAIGGVLLSIALLPPPIEACNALLLNTSGQPGAVVAYGRDMQLDSDMETKAIWVPARTVVPFAPICETCTFTNFSVRYGFVGMLAYPEFTSGVCESFGLSNCIFTLNEGMNTAGLGVSVLWDTTVKTYANYTLPQDVKPRKGVAASDLIAFLLGSCATIKDVKAILTTVNVTNLVLPEPLNSLVIQLLAGSLAIHLTIVDATGAMIVIEFDSLGNLLTKVSPMGVLTNEPQLEVQYALLANYTAANFQTPGPDFPVPGGFDPVARFQRMALLNYAANYYPYQSESYSPWDGSNVTSGKSQMVQVYNLLNKVSLPLAINYINQLEYDDPSLNLTTPTEKDRTQYLVLRDHTNLKFYYSTPYDLTLRSLSLNYLKIRRPRVGVYGIPLNAFKDWSKDVSGSMPMSASQFGTAGQVVTKG